MVMKMVSTKAATSLVKRTAPRSTDAPSTVSSEGIGDGMNEGSGEGCDVVGYGDMEGAGVG